MKVWLFDEEQLEVALAAMIANAAHQLDDGGNAFDITSAAKSVRAFLHSPGAVQNKLVIEVKPKLAARAGSELVVEPKS